MTNEIKETAPVQTAGTTVKPLVIPRTTQRIVRDALWYLSRKEEELKDVTDAKVNLAIGVTDIFVSPASDAQQAYYTVANITLNTVVGSITGIQVKESEHTPGSLYLQTPSRNVAKEGEKARWMNDVKLERPVQAQILSHVASMLVSR
jgi:hypothetical protein